MFWQLLPCFGNFEQFLPCFGSRGNFWQIRITGKGLAWKQLGTQCSVGVMPRWDELRGQVTASEVARPACTAFWVHLRWSVIQMPWIWATMDWFVHFSTQPTAGLLWIGRFQSKLLDFLHLLPQIPATHLSNQKKKENILEHPFLACSGHFSGSQRLIFTHPTSQWSYIMFRGQTHPLGPFMPS